MKADNAEIVARLRARLPKEAFVNISDYQILVMYLMLRKDINETIKNDTLQAMRAAMVFVSNLHENRHIEPPAQEAKPIPKSNPLPNDFRVDVSLENGFTVTSLPEPKAIPKTKKPTDYEIAEKCVRTALERNVALNELCVVVAKTGREVDLDYWDYVLLANKSPFSLNQIKDAFRSMQIKWPKAKAKAKA